MQKLLTKPHLKGSELLYNFLASENEFTTSFLPDIKIGNWGCLVQFRSRWYLCAREGTMGRKVCSFALNSLGCFGLGFGSDRHFYDYFLFSLVEQKYLSLSFCFQSWKTLKMFKIDDLESVCVRECVWVCLSVCMSSASVSLETIEVIIIKLGMATASDMVMHIHVNYIDLDLHSRSHRS